METEFVNTSFTLPRPLLEELKEIARLEGRSASAQARLFLAQSVTRKNKTKQKPRTPLQTAA